MVCRRRIGCGDAGVRGSDDLDVARFEVRAQRGELVVVEIVLDGKRLERALLDRPPLLGLLERGADRCFKRDGAQNSSLPFCRDPIRRGALAGPRQASTAQPTA
jgi:hypothetical protein